MPELFVFLDVDLCENSGEEKQVLNGIENVFEDQIDSMRDDWLMNSYFIDEFTDELAMGENVIWKVFYMSDISSINQFLL